MPKKLVYSWISLNYVLTIFKQVTIFFYAIDGSSNIVINFLLKYILCPHFFMYSLNCECNQSSATLSICNLRLLQK